jgi:hypothetical protein
MGKERPTIIINGIRYSRRDIIGFVGRVNFINTPQSEIDSYIHHHLEMRDGSILEFPPGQVREVQRFILENDSLIGEK